MIYENDGYSVWMASVVQQDKAYVFYAKGYAFELRRGRQKTAKCNILAVF